MGVLDAWIGADKVGYQVVGEKIKDPSNVVDYDIHDEITKDASAAINANNDTTTGMATVIPGINAPKLLATTSIIGGSAGGWNILTSSASYGVSSNPGTSFTKYNVESFSSLGGDLYLSGGDIHCDGGTYLINTHSLFNNINVTQSEYQFRVWNNGNYTTIASWYGGRASSYSFVYTFNVGDYIMLYVMLDYGTSNGDVFFDFIKLK